MDSGSRTGTVTFLFTDIEGSTRLWEQEPERMRPALACHDALARGAVESNHGTVVKMTGDGVCGAFDDPLDAINATLQLQQALTNPEATQCVALRVRAGLHLGVVERRDNDYFGSPVNRGARIMSAANGGQVLLSQAVADCVREVLPAEVSLRDLGKVRLKDLSTPEHVYQVVHPQLRQEFPALRSLDSTPNNLPQQLTSFIGREKEIAEVRTLLDKTRLLTLTGSGGCGKTRLSLQVAAGLLDFYADGVWLVELAALADPDLVPQTVAIVLGLKEEPNKSLTQTLIEHLKSKHLLLVLDNAEHLLSACAQLADVVLRQCPQVVMLMTSREGLGMNGELTYRVPSLSMPDPKRDATLERLSQYESVRLFVERALFHLPQFSVTNQNAPALASICYRLEGIPLAIELAAARVRSMSVEEVNRGLDQRFRLLIGGSRTALPRQQTLRSLVDWSYDLLGDAEKALFCRVSVFSGGWTLEAAQQVCIREGVDDGEALDLLTSLADKNLVVAEEQHGATRYRLLETVRQYARDRLRERGEEAQCQGRHLAYFMELAEEAEPELTGANQQAWLDRLQTEHENLRAALAWSSTAGGDSASGLMLAGAISRFWAVRGYLHEGRGWLSRLLAAAPNAQTAARANALRWVGVLAWRQGDYTTARELYEGSLAIQRGLGDRLGIAGTLNNLGVVTTDQGDYPAARALLEESLGISRMLGNRWSIATSLNNLGVAANCEGDHSSAWALHEEALAIRQDLNDRWGIASSLNNLGIAALNAGDYSPARALFEQSLAIRKELDDRWGISASLNNLGLVADEQGDYASALAFHKGSLANRTEIGDRQGIAQSLDGFASVASALAEPRRAASLWGAAERLREEIGAPLSPSVRRHYNPKVAAARAALGDDAGFDCAWQQGRALTLEQAIELASENSFEQA